ncbi:ImmA/IrrE family metallo-endopeptidase [Enterococcus hulanensis]|uniref:ImmA/IrrE family metallo-endopeptidase n=1 Tax=Enterococcus hulanensis TaxID=2559929 RepID=UPI0028920699|nr:ImmA/IrrE family metallo-endopeptidase [Enterococcus hulanensis]
MDREISELIKELGVDIIYVPELDSGGKYIAAINTIVIDSRLSERDKRRVLLHELGHAAKHQNNFELYNCAYSLHSKMENEANEFMLDSLVQSYIRTVDLDGKYLNYMKFIEDNEIDTRYEFVVKELFTKYIYRTQIV